MEVAHLVSTGVHIIPISRFFLTLFVRSNMYDHKLWTHSLGVLELCHSRNPKLACGIIHGDQWIPLENDQWSTRIDPQTNLFACGVESVAVTTSQEAEGSKLGCPLSSHWALPESKHTQWVLYAHVRGMKVSISDDRIEVIIVFIQSFAFSFPKAWRSHQPSTRWWRCRPEKAAIENIAYWVRLSNRLNLCWK